MKTTIINKIQTVFICAAMMSGLVACSNAPSTWSEVDNSPWKGKRAAESVNMAADDFVEVSSEDMTQLVEPVEIRMETAPEVQAEPEVLPEPVPVVMADPEPIVVTGLDAASEAGFVVQVFAGVSEASVDRYKNAHDLYEMIPVKTIRDGKIMYVLVSLHDYKSEAIQAAESVYQRTGSKPWVRTVAGLRKYAID